MQAKNQTHGQQPVALAELAETTREKVPGDGPREMDADGENKPVRTQNAKKHEVAEKLLNAGAKGKKLDPESAGVIELPDRTKSKT